MEHVKSDDFEIPEGVVIRYFYQKKNNDVWPYPQTAKMDQSKQMKITISTQNVNGFTRNKDFLRLQCDESPYSIRAIQEHWLKPPYKKQIGVNQLRSLHPDFDGFGTSAMKK